MAGDDLDAIANLPAVAASVELGATTLVSAVVMAIDRHFNQGVASGILQGKEMVHTRRWNIREVDGEPNAIEVCRRMHDKRDPCEYERFVIPTELMDLLREVIGDDDPRTWETDEQWAEILDGRGEHDHIEISVYAGTLRRILARVRDRAKATDAV